MSAPQRTSSQNRGAASTHTRQGLHLAQDMDMRTSSTAVTSADQAVQQSGARRPSPMRLKSHDQVSDPERTPRLHDLPKIISTLPTPRRLPLGPLDTDQDYFLLQPSASQPPSTSDSDMSASGTPLTPPRLAAATTSSSPASSKHSPANDTASVSSSIGRRSSHSLMAAELAAQGSHPPRDVPVRPPPAPLQTTPPRYPNQAYSALQYHGRSLFTPHSAPGVQRNLALHTASSSPKDGFLSRPYPFPSVSRTAGNSPATTPGLFEPHSATTPATPSTAGPFSYLNNLQTRLPKETKVADIDVDPISGRKLINDYEIIGELGRGVHGKVKLGRNIETGQHVAIKIVKRYPNRRRLGKSEKADDKVKREVAILKKARHTNIVALLEVIDDPARNKVYIVLERVDLGEINWRANPSHAREIALVEYRRYERESHGVFDDEIAEQEDKAILELARVQRAKAARVRAKTLRRQDTGAWSIETAGGIGDDSDLEDFSRGSISTESQAGGGSVAESMSRRSSAVSMTHSVRSQSPGAARKSSLANELNPDTSDRPASNADAVAVPSSIIMPLYTEPEPITNRKDTNLMQRAIQITTETEMLPDLQYVPTMTVQAARLAFRDTLLGLQYLHYHGVIHRDIKPPNLLQTRDHRIKISDFGVSYLGRPVHEQSTENVPEPDEEDFDEAKELAKTVGTAAFYAPELCYTDGADNQPPVGYAIDVWALGITLFCMLFARVPIAEGSEYVAMRRIADEEIYIPSKRLLPLGSQSSSYDIIHPPTPGTRAPASLVYEELDDTLLDLLRRLLIKDPGQRITLEEVRHHPWVVADIAEKERWLDETDPVVQASGKKIEITKEDVELSVQPISFVNRVRSGIKKAVAAGFGLGRSSSTRKKEAATAAALASTTTTPTTAGSSSAASEPRKVVMARGDETIVTALKASREGDPILAQSLPASSERTRQEDLLSATATVSTPQYEEAHKPLYQALRPADVDTVATTSSAGTIRPTDEGLKSSSRGPSRSGSPSPETSAESPGLSSSILGGASRLLRSVSSRGRSRATHGAESRGRSSSRASTSDNSDARATASLAISTASAAGEIDGPDVLKDTSTPSTSASQSLASSPAMASVLTFANSRHADEKFRYSRQNSTASTGRVDRSGNASRTHSRSSSLLRNMSTEEDFSQPENDMLRRRLAEVQAARASPSASRRSSAAQVPDMSHGSTASSVAAEESSIQQRRDHRASFLSNSTSSMAPSLETSPASALSAAMPLITPSGSHDGFALGYSFHNSNPTISTVMSQEAPGSRIIRDGVSDKLETSPLPDTPQTARQSTSPAILEEEDEGYDPDPASEPDQDAESSDDDDDDDDDDEEEGLQMMGRHRPHGRGATLMPSNVSAARHRERRGTAGSALSKRSSRSGSNNTMRRVVSSPAESEPQS